jgi:excisionase family DNA binding protein
MRNQSKSSAKSTNNTGPLFDILTVDELGAILKLAPKTIRNWASRREIPFVMLNKRIYFRASEVDAWLRKKEVKPWQ